MKYKIHNYLWNLSRNSQESVFRVLEYIETLTHRENFYLLLLKDEEKKESESTIVLRVSPKQLHSIVYISSWYKSIFIGCSTFEKTAVVSSSAPSKEHDF